MRIQKEIPRDERGDQIGFCVSSSDQSAPSSPHPLGRGYIDPSVLNERRAVMSTREEE